MKKTVLTLFSIFVLLNYASAQVSIYSFAQSTGTYAPITGGTILGSITDDDQMFVDPATPLGGGTATGIGFPIGFNFTYNGLVFDKLAINSNGWISLGQSSLTPSVNMASASGFSVIISQTSTATPTLLRNRIAGLARDLAAQAGSSLRIQTTGSTPNRICIIQWANYKKIGATGDNLNFQIQLKEISNSVVVMYGTNTNNATIAYAQAGLGGTIPSDFNIRKTSSDWSATMAGIVNTDTCRLSATVKPASGQTYTWTPPPACTGTPTVGTASAPAGACSGIAFNLTLAGYTNTTSGITFQWQSSTTSGGTYANITGGTTPIFSTTQTTAMYYRCIVTCTATTLTATSNNVNVIMNTGINCYCVAVHSGACSASDNIDSVQIVSTTLANLNTGCTGTNGNAYSIYPASGNTTATLNAGSAYTFKVTTTTSDIVSIWIDYNQNGIFDAIEWTQVCLTSVANAPNTVSITIPPSAMAGLTGMRVRSRIAGFANGPADPCSTFGTGETEDYKVTIVAAPPCSGTPIAGAASAPSGACNGVAFNLTLSGYSVSSGLTFQWVSSTTSGGTYTNIAGATNPSVSIIQTTAMYYKCIVTCTASGLSATTSPINVIMNATINCYCTPPASTCSLGDIIYNVTMATINNSTTCSTNGYSSYPTPNPTLNAGASYPVSVFVGHGGTEYVAAWIDYNQNGVFDASEFTSIGSGDSIAVTGNIAIPSTASIGSTMMRIRVQYNAAFTGTDACTGANIGRGETEDYKVTLAVSTGINENSIGNITIYPNPTSGLFNIKASNASFTELAIGVFDIQGKEVFNALDKNTSSNYNKQINLEGLSKGIYFIKLNTDKGVNIQKLIVQ